MKKLFVSGLILTSLFGGGAEASFNSWGFKTNILKNSLANYKGMGDTLTADEFSDIMKVAGYLARGIFVDYDSRKVGIGVEKPTEALEVAGTVKADKFVGDGSKLTGVAITAADIKTKYESNPNTNTYTDTEKAKVDELEEGLAALRTVVDGLVPDYLVNYEHTYRDCELQGGIVTTVMEAGQKVVMCKFPQSSCPVHWTQYRSYTQVARSECLSKNGESCESMAQICPNCVGWDNTLYKMCSFLSESVIIKGYSFSNQAPVNVSYLYYWDLSDPCEYRTCYSNITQIGCY